MRSSSAVAKPPRLTPREREVLDRIALAYESRSIAAELRISHNTLRGYTQNILEKLGAHSRLEAVVKAGRLGLLSPTVDLSQLDRSPISDRGQ